mmetsp:Transcript_20106/g.22775  ORF Transcript_20106/g.22775 Transcript_20106/m.22775 type:complete len:201 (-) Transcript_20106:379-981(-)
MTKQNMSNIRIEAVQDKSLANLASIQATFLNSKHMCCCLPLGIDSTEDKLRKMYSKTPELMEVTAIAIKEDEVLGFVQLILSGMPCELHKVKPGEAYVHMIAVDHEARGMGIGTRLLQWAEEIARKRDCTYMSLDVLGGNMAIELYERNGFVVIPPTTCTSHLSLFAYVCCLFGPVICTFGSPSYCTHGRLHRMVKQLKS